MDYLSSWYDAIGRWGPGASDTFLIQWYKCAPGAKVYLGVHAFGSTVDAGCQGDDTTVVGEILRLVPGTWGIRHAVEDGKTPAEVPEYLRYGVPAFIANGICLDASLAMAPTVSSGFPPVVYGLSACSCSAAVLPG